MKLKALKCNNLLTSRIFVLQDVYISHYISVVYAIPFNHDKPTRSSNALAVRATFLTSTSSAVSMTSFHTNSWQNCSRFLGRSFAFWRPLRLT